MTGSEFEGYVRRIARAIWDAPPGVGAPIKIDGQERDCIIETADVTYYIECSTLRTLEKLKSDAGKMIAFRSREERKNRLVKLYFVTQEEPTADQQQYGRDRNISVISIAELGKRLLNAGQYLELRINHAFGSATDPKTDSNLTWDLAYEAVAIRTSEANLRSLTTENVARELMAGKVACLLGDFGMGKSVTLRETFGSLRKAYFNQETENCPVLLNLREHWGQDDPQEALERHAKKIGFSAPQQLVRAFNAGRLIVMLDGFDEIASIAWEPAGGATRLREMRRGAVSLVRSFVQEARGKCGIILAGREHYFDAVDELTQSLGLKSGDLILRLGEFSDTEAQRFLEKMGYTEPLPAWLPKRPLLLAKLAADGTLRLLLENTEAEPAKAWTMLLDAVCERESRIHKTHLAPAAIKRILEVLASRARCKPDGLGPLSENEVAEAFREVVQAYPDEKTRPLLQRLPGLSARSTQTGDRSFIDDQMLDALRAGDVIAFALTPFSSSFGAHEWKHGLGPLGTAIAGQSLGGQFPMAHLVVAAREAAVRWNAPTLAADVVLTTTRAFPALDEIDFDGLKAAGADVDTLDLSESPLPVNWTLSDSTIHTIIVGDGAPRGFSANDCLIQHLVGCATAADMPKWLSGCDVSSFDVTPQTNAAIAADNTLSPALRVFLVVLRKLYMQRGTGRQERAFARGLEPALRPFVDRVLPVIERHSLAHPVRRGTVTIWQPLAGKRGRVAAILAAGAQSSDSSVRDILELT